MSASIVEQHVGNLYADGTVKGAIITGSTAVYTPTLTSATISGSTKIIATRLVNKATGATGSYADFTGSMHVGEIYILAPTSGTTNACWVVKLKTGSSATTCGIYTGSGLEYLGEAPIA